MFFAGGKGVIARNAVGSQELDLAKSRRSKNSLVTAKFAGNGR
jgi:hypothetical protein